MPSTTDPIVNFDTTYDQLMSGSIPDEKRDRIGKELLEAFENDGYVYLQNFGQFEEWLNEYRSCSEQFLSLPLEVKSKYPRDLKTFHGWSLSEDERPEGCPKANESIDISILDRIPTEVPNFKACAQYGYNFLQKLSRFVFSAFESALEFEPNYLNDKCSFNNYEKNINQFKFIRYPPLEEKDLNTQRFVSHKDFGAITFLFLDEVGGLELQTHSGEWIEARTDIPHGFLMIAGGMMSTITGGRVSAVEHRVVSRKNMTKYRRSVIFFTAFDWDVHVKAHDEPVTESTETVLDLFTRMGKEVYKSAKDEDFPQAPTK